jgi:hypothetical protein
MTNDFVVANTVLAGGGNVEVSFAGKLVSDLGRAVSVL